MNAPELDCQRLVVRGCQHGLLGVKAENRPRCDVDHVDGNGPSPVIDGASDEEPLPVLGEQRLLGRRRVQDAPVKLEAVAPALAEGRP